MLNNNGIESRDIWSEVSRFFMKEKYKPQHMTLEKFYTKNKFGLLIDLRSIHPCHTAAILDMTYVF